MAEDLKLRVRRGRFATAAEPTPSVDGTASASLTVSDAVGNSFTASTTVAIDPDYNETASVSGPPGTLGSVSASAVAFTVGTPDGNETGSLTLTDGGNNLTVSVTGGGTYTENLSTWMDGNVVVTLHVSDAAGNSFTASTTVAIDPDHGETATLRSAINHGGGVRIRPADAASAISSPSWSPPTCK